MAPFEALTSLFRGNEKAVRSADRSEAWLQENAVAIVHLAALSLAKGGATFSFEELVETAQDLSRDVPLDRDRIIASLAQADVERCMDGRLCLVA
jgi:hypothetical protein